ncbi:hypothetical protein [Kineobactrum salinum]|uniref:Uncharacterized protein n=1 Tax=Kineobactrum salinum TaxID=2708301 RepID=A0A6C0TXV0_9GAMM|nr:hypothetical protein [Kineobactrum salinum]QIB64660.1 hypothetical protein G3T16_03865 [Kineobactrum salinum]
MKAIAALTTALVVAGSALAAQAARDDSRHLVLCKSEVETALGEGSRSKLLTIKRRRGPDELRLKVVPEQGGSMVVRCSVSDGRVQLFDRDGVALNLRGAGGREAVSLTD